MLDEYKGETIAIVGHATAFAFFLSNWCDISYDGGYSYKDKVLFEGNFNYLETFKLVFDQDNNLVSIDNLYHNYINIKKLK